MSKFKDKFALKGYTNPENTEGVSNVAYAFAKLIAVLGVIFLVLMALTFFLPAIGFAVFWLIGFIFGLSLIAIPLGIILGIVCLVLYLTNR